MTATKTQIYEFVERQKQEAMANLNEKCNADKVKYLEELEHDKILQPLWNDFINAAKELVTTIKLLDENLPNCSYGGYKQSYFHDIFYNIKFSHLIECYYDNNMKDIIAMMCKKMYYRTTIYDKFNKEYNATHNEYDILMENVKKLKVKQAIEYLRNIGFDVSCLGEDNVDPCELLTQINPNNLFVAPAALPAGQEDDVIELQ